MEQVGKSSLWVERYRPTTTKDLISPSGTATLFKNIVAEGDMQNLLFYGTAGIGKTSAAKALVRDINGQVKYINGSLETSIDMIRDTVVQFATTHSAISLGDEKTGPKVVILDECERISPHGQDALKVVLEQAESNCRFIFCTNNLQKIIKPLHSRCKLVSFNYERNQIKEIILQYFKRIQFVLHSEGIECGKPEKAILAEFIQNYFPDFRKMLNELQGYVKETGKVDLGLLKVGSDGMTGDLIEILKSREFGKMRKLCTEIDPDQFYKSFYNDVDKSCKPEAIPDVVLTLAEYAHKHVLTVDQEINLVACCTELMRALHGKWK